MKKQKQGKWIFIINPVAGNRYAGNHEKDIRRQCEKRGITYEIVETEGKGHATELARAYGDKGFDHIIAVGGDGTINETAHGIMGKKGIIFGAIAAGTGNDLIQIMGFNDRFDESDWDAFFDHDTICMDAGYCNGNHFFNGMGLGFDAQVAAENYTTDPSHKVKLGSKYKYIWHIVKTLLTYKSGTMRLITEKNSVVTTCFMNTVAIGRRFAGSFFLTPNAMANDGLLDICNIQELTFPQRIKIFLKVPTGTHIEMPQVNYYQTSSLNIEFDRVVPYHLDGELYFDSKFDIKVLPCSLKVIYKKSGDHYFDDSAS